MPIKAFPPVERANEYGLVAVGGDLHPQTLVLAYQSGIFPWPLQERTPIPWFSPDPRGVLEFEDLRISKSFQKFLKKTNFSITYNQCFEEVISHCAFSSTRKDGQGTWITQELLEAYITFHQQGYAYSVEVWDEHEIVGGLYGVDLGNGIFTGESMFAKESNASKVAFISFIQNTDYKLIDCQVYTNHLASLGAEDIPRDTFLKLLRG